MYGNNKDTGLSTEFVAADVSRKICDCLSDGYDDEEYRKETEKGLYLELLQLGENSYVKAVLIKLCERIENLEV